MTTPFATRVTGPEDAHAVGELLRSSYPVLMRPAYGGSLSAVLDVLTRPSPALLGSGTFYAAENGQGYMVGIGGWSGERPGDAALEPGLAHLRHFATHPDWCRRGVARLLYETCEANARKAGIEVLECYSSFNAEPFYAALGFVSVARIDVPMGGGRAVLGGDPDAASYLNALGRASPGMWQDTRRRIPSPRRRLHRESDRTRTASSGRARDPGRRGPGCRPERYRGPARHEAHARIPARPGPRAVARPRPRRHLALRPHQHPLRHRQSQHVGVDAAQRRALLLHRDRGSRRPLRVRQCLPSRGRAGNHRRAAPGGVVVLLRGRRRMREPGAQVGRGARGSGQDSRRRQYEACGRSLRLSRCRRPAQPRRGNGRGPEADGGCPGVEVGRRDPVHEVGHRGVRGGHGPDARCIARRHDGERTVGDSAPNQHRDGR